MITGSWIVLIHIGSQTYNNTKQCTPETSIKVAFEFPDHCMSERNNIVILMP